MLHNLLGFLGSRMARVAVAGAVVGLGLKILKDVAEEYVQDVDLARTELEGLERSYDATWRDRYESELAQERADRAQRRADAPDTETVERVDEGLRGLD